MCRRGAAVVLAFSADGIRVLTQLLREGDLFERESAIFAFDELTETSNYPEDSSQAMREAIPAIARATKEKDKTLSCMADEVLGQIARGSNDELSKLARINAGCAISSLDSPGSVGAYLNRCVEPVARLPAL